MRHRRAYQLVSFGTAALLGLTPGASVHAENLHRVFAAPAIIKASGWTATCYATAVTVTDCAVTRDSGGAPLRLDIIASKLSIAFPAACENIGLWKTQTKGRRRAGTPAMIRFIERALAKRNCGLIEAENVGSLIDLVTVLLSATRAY